MLFTAAARDVRAIFSHQSNVDRSHPMKLSARNQLKGKILGVQKGQTTAHVRIDIGGGVVVTASITNEAVDDLAIKTGDDAFAVIKASDVMIAK
jgi:molybdopterin-binding protein